jgi:hypothetical protein
MGLELPALMTVFARFHTGGHSLAGVLRTRFHYPYCRPGFWVRGGSRAFARVSSRTLGRYVAVTNPAPPRCPVPTDFNGFMWLSRPQTTPEEPRQRNAGPLGAPKRRPDPPQPALHPPRLVCGGNHGAGTHWCPSGGAPRWWRPGRRRPKPSRFLCGNAQGPSFHQAQGPTAPAFFFLQHRLYLVH